MVQCYRRSTVLRYAARFSAHAASKLLLCVAQHLRSFPRAKLAKKLQSDDDDGFRVRQCTVTNLYFSPVSNNTTYDNMRRAEDTAASFCIEVIE